MKKMISIALTLALILFSIPIAAYAVQVDQVIDKHGAKTYIGTTASWGKAWDESNFVEVTGEDVDASGNLTVKIGDVKNITITGATSKLIVTDGTINSIKSEGGITLNGGTIKRDVESDTAVAINGKVSIGGDCTAQDITASSSVTATVVGSVIGNNSITLSGQSLKAREFNGNGKGMLAVKSYTLSLPAITDMETVTIDGSNKASGKIITGTLLINSKSELTANSTIEVDTLEGPGTLSFYSGKLTVHTGITDKPLIYFNNTVGNGTLAFKADVGAVGEDDVKLYDYQLEKDTYSSYESFILKNSITDGITLDQSSLDVNSKTSGLVRASVKPAFSQFAAGTKIVWELHGDTTAFSISPDTTKNTCKVTLSSSTTGSNRATLIAYLVDKNNDRLSDYKSDSCTISSGTAAVPVDNSGLTLDTSAVTIPADNTYWVLAVTSSASAPQQLSYNSSIATVGAAVAYNYNGKVGWLYPVKGIAKGAVTIDIGGKKMLTTVAGGSITVDTASYTMSPGSKYYIGVKINKLDKKSLNIYSGNSCTDVQDAGKAANGMELYVVTARQAGTGHVTFAIIGGQSVSTTINVVSGVSPSGVSGRLVAVA